MRIRDVYNLDWLTSTSRATFEKTSVMQCSARGVWMFELWIQNVWCQATEGHQGWLKSTVCPSIIEALMESSILPSSRCSPVGHTFYFIWTIWIVQFVCCYKLCQLSYFFILLKRRNISRVVQFLLGMKKRSRECFGLDLAWALARTRPMVYTARPSSELRMEQIFLYFQSQVSSWFLAAGTWAVWEHLCNIAGI